MQRNRGIMYGTNIELIIYDSIIAMVIKACKKTKTHCKKLNIHYEFAISQMRKPVAEINKN